MQRNRRLVRTVLAGVFVVAAAGSVTACSGGEPAPVGGGAGEGAAQASGSPVNDMGYMVHTDHVAHEATTLPEYASTPELARLYTFAYEHPEVMTYMPCTCGCGAMGHNSNWNCYVKSIDANGAVIFDEHAVNCGVCQEITADVIRSWQRGSPLQEIRDFVDATYPGSQTPTDYPAGM
jgi:hypothetical protein